MTNPPGSPLPLAGVRVVELGNYIAGPGTAMALGDLGAEVIKIEPPGGDMARHTGHYGHAMLRAYNRSKKSVAVDLRQAAGLEVARRLIASADVVVQNLRPGAAEKLGLGAQAMRQLYPRLVYASITGFPSTGPSSSRPGYDIAAQAESGMMSITGDPDGLPQKVGAPIVDTATAHVTAQAILAALFRRERLNIGETIEVSLLEVALHLQLPSWSDFIVRGVEPTRTGDGQPMNAPAADIVRTRDGLIVLSAYADAHWLRFCQTVGRPELAEDPRFRNNDLRVANRPALKQVLAECLSRYSTAECVDLLTRNNIVVAAVRRYKEAVASDDFRRSSMLVDVAEEGNQPSYRSFGLPYQFGDTARRETSASPCTGAHTEAVLLQAGFSPAEIMELRGQAVIASPGTAVTVTAS